MIKKLKASTKTGQKMLESALECKYHDLSQCYGRYSANKEYAYRECLDEFVNSEDARCFGVKPLGCNFFGCSWYCRIGGERVMVYKTGRNDYWIYLDK